MKHRTPQNERQMPTADPFPRSHNLREIFRRDMEENPMPGEKVEKVREAVFSAIRSQSIGTESPNEDTGV